MDADDRQVGRILSRREILALFGAAGAGVLAGCAPSQPGAAEPTGVPGNDPTAAAAPTSGVASATATVPVPTVAAEASLPACVVRPELTEGPYYVDEELNRSDIRSDPGTGVVSAGVPLALAFRVSQVVGSACAPLAGAKVEVWHCDATGRYSDVADPGGNTQGQQFLRGYQVTDGAGMARFTTIYPGGYRGRAVHIHFKVRPDANSEFTSQLFFDDTLSDQVFAAAPYAATAAGRTRNSQDGIYTDLMLLELVPEGDGYATTFDMAVQAA